jgi:hypothetical protein
MQNRARELFVKASRVAVRLLSYLVPLLWDALKHLWRLSLDAIGGVRIIVFHWLARRTPARAAEFATSQTKVRDERAARWVSWHPVPDARKLEVRIAAVALVLIMLLGARWRTEQWWYSRLALAETNADGEIEPEPEVEPERDSSTESVRVDTRPAPERFQSAVQSARPNDWAILEAPVLSRSPRGTWDDFRIGSPVVVNEGDAYRMWFVGCRLARLEYDCSVGHATSRDKLTWTKSNSPVLVPPNLPKPYWMSAIAVAKVPDRFLLWYSIDADTFANPPRRATVHLATSSDGVSWQDGGVVITATADSTRSITHSVLFDGQRLHLWYVDVAGDDDGKALIHVSSSDGKNWTSVGHDAIDGLARTIGRVWVTRDSHGTYRALFVDHRNRPTLRWLDSRDGTTWTAGDVVRESRIGDDGVMIFDAVGSQERDGLWLWLTTGLRDSGAEEIGLAFKKGSG